MNRREKKSKIGEFEYTESELYENEEDRNRIMALSELDRERILDERLKKLLEKKERDEALRQKSDMTNIRKKDALHEIRKKRSQKRDRVEGAKAGGDSYDPYDNLSSLSSVSYSESGEVSEDKDDDYSSSDYSHSEAGDRKRATKRSRSSSDDVLSIGSNEKKKKESSLTISDLERIKVTRGFLEKYWEIPIFNSMTQGCFVKISYVAKSNQNRYILAQIKGIVENKDKPYNLANKQCTKYLITEHDTQSKPISFNIISNSNISEMEFRQWKDKMDKFKCTLPDLSTVARYAENLESVKNYIYSNEQFQEMINKKKDLKIQRQDKNMNITYELTLFSEEYNSAKMKYEETKDVKYFNRMNELLPKIENLTKMAQDRENQDCNHAEVDKISQINKKNFEKQRLNDLRNSLINRKSKRDDKLINPYKRRDCHPINLFDSGYLKKTEVKVETDTKAEDEEISKVEDLDIEFTPHRIYEKRRNTLRSIEQAFISITNDLDAVYHLKKENEATQNINKKNDKFIFSVLGVNQSDVAKIVNIHNSKFQKDKFKIISLKDLEY